MFDALLNAGMAIAQNGFLLKNSPACNRTMFVAAGTALAGLVGGITSIVTGAAIALAGDWTVPVAGDAWGAYEIAFAVSILLRLVGAWLSRYVRESSTRTTAAEVLVHLIGVTPLRVLRFPLVLTRSRTAETAPSPVTIPIAPAYAPLSTRDRVRAA
jgi:hypothetical protein